MKRPHWFEQIESAILANNTKHAIEIYEHAIRKAKIDAVTEWAWWKDGTQYVGTCGNTLATAINMIQKEPVE